MLPADPEKFAVSIAEFMAVAEYVRRQRRDGTGKKLSGFATASLLRTDFVKWQGRSDVSPSKCYEHRKECKPFKACGPRHSQKPTDHA